MVEGFEDVLVLAGAAGRAFADVAPNIGAKDLIVLTMGARAISGGEECMDGGWGLSAGNG